ncbi:MAG TPA: L,D-transpeptidase [Thermoanaerobaculaceae bacterium]|nr:L,D-transpeptidase [Thermoanaerobaculaceae bacterium]
MTAAGNRRRFAVRLAAAAGASLLLACSGRPAPDLEGARRAAHRAVRLVRPEEPLQARLIERLVADAETATAAEASAPFWEGSVGRTEAAWFRAIHAARLAASRVHARQAQATARAGSLLRVAQDEVARARAEINETGMGRREGAAMSTAAASLETAQRLAGGGRNESAAEELRQAIENAAVVHRGWRNLHARFSDPSLRRTWNEWAEKTIEGSRQSGAAAIVIDKLRRRVFLYQGGRVALSFPAELGANGLRRKEHSGDRATPEGLYKVVEAKEGHTTRYNRALLINYPNDEDRMRFALARARGQVSSRAAIGGLIEIHGDGGEGRDWTDGCVALTNADMERLFARVGVGTPVTIVGTYER